MQVQLNDAPLVVATFKIHAVPNEIKSRTEGRPIYDEMEVCELKYAGNKHTVGVFPAHEVFAWENDANGVRQPVTYAMKFNQQYQAFKNGDVQLQSGTPLEALPFLTTGKRLELKALNINTAEALAALDGNNLKRLGMGGRDLKDQAQTYLDEASTKAVQNEMTDIVSSQDKRIAELEAQIASLTAAASGNAAKTPAATENAPVDDGTGGNPATATPSPFADFSDEDLKNWLKEAAPDLAIDGRWSKATLIEKAEEVNKTLADKNKAS